MNPSLPVYPWYAVVSGSEVQQGDILERCPVFSPPEKMDSEGFADVKRTRRDVIVMTQSCDLDPTRNKAPEVLLCVFINAFKFRWTTSWQESINLENARKGNMPAFHLLADCHLDDFARELTVVDFRRVYSLPYDFVQQQATSFARYFMRVGLPIDIPSLRR